MSNLETSRTERLDQHVVAMLPALSRAFAAKLITEGRVTVNGQVTTRPGHKLRSTDAVSVDYDAAHDSQIPDIVLSVLYEDQDCVVINKPAGVLSHSKGAFNPEGTVASWLRQHDRYAPAGEMTSAAPLPLNDRSGIVHRLDRGTSGVMICAKHQAALAWLQKQFANRKVKKVYQAIITGELAADQAVIDMPIERNPRQPQTFRVGANGKTAVTEYKILKTVHGLSLLELRPQTGRTHQLRVHLAHLGHPIVGDTFYAGRPADRLYLHAKSLEITIPSRQRKVFVAPVPKEFNELLVS